MKSRPKSKNQKMQEKLHQEEQFSPQVIKEHIESTHEQYYQLSLAMEAAPKIELSGTALMGIEPCLTRAAMISEGINELPSTVCLGCILPKSRPAALRLSSYLNLNVAAAGLPESTNYRAKAAASIARMYVNDRMGCCVVAGKAHMFGVWTGNDLNAAVLATDQEIISQYQSWCGPGDRGCMITNVLNIIKTNGMLINGVLHKIEGYVAVDWTNQLEVKTVLYLSGASCIGFMLPQAWTQNATWDITTTRIVGGHDVTPIDYDLTGVYVASWGRIYLILWAAFLSRRWLTEQYMLLGKDWWNDDGLAPNGVDVATLRMDQIKIGEGTIPPIDPPNPPIPPIPPIPPVPPIPPIPPQPPVPPIPPVNGNFIISEQTTSASGKRRIVLSN